MFKVYDYSRVKISLTTDISTTEVETLRKSLELDNVFSLHTVQAQDAIVTETRVTRYSRKDPYDKPVKA